MKVSEDILINIKSTSISASELNHCSVNDVFIEANTWKSHGQPRLFLLKIEINTSFACEDVSTMEFDVWILVGSEHQILLPATISGKNNSQIFAACYSF